MVMSKYQIKQTLCEPYSPFQNRAEGSIREIKKAVSQAMSKAKAPKHLWVFCAIYMAEIRFFTATDQYQLHGRTPYEIVTGNMPDISR